MAKHPTFTDITSNGFQAIDAYNNNLDALETAFNNTLSRDGSTPNSMEAELDLNSNKIINLKDPTVAADGANKRYVDEVASALVAGNLSTTVLSYSSVADLKALAGSSLANGQLVKTKGYYDANDGGDALYIYTTGGSGSGDDMFIIDLTDGTGHFDMVTSGRRVSLAALGGKSDGLTASATQNRIAFQAAIDAEVMIFVPKGTGDYYVNAATPLAASGTFAQTGAVVVDVPFDCVFEKGAVMTLASQQYVNIIQVIAGCTSFRLIDAEMDGGSSNFLIGTVQVTNIGGEDFLVNNVSPILFNGGDNIYIENFRCLSSVYGAIQTNPYVQIDDMVIEGMYVNGCYSGLHTNGDVATADRFVRRLTVNNFHAVSTLTEGMDINRGIYEFNLNNPILYNCYTYDSGEFHKESLDIQDCVRVNINNPIIDMNRQAGTGLRIKATNDTREITVTSPNIANSALVTKQNMISTATGDWTVATGVGISGGVLTWTGTAGNVDAVQTQNTALGVSYDLGTNDGDTTKAFIVEVPVTVTSGTLFVSLGSGSNLTNSSYRSMAITSSGRYTFVVLGDDGDAITFRGATFTGSVDLADVTVQENVGAAIAVQNCQNVTITNPMLRSVSMGIQVFDLGNDVTESLSITGGIIDGVVLDGVSVACHSNINSAVQTVDSVSITGLSMFDIGRYCYDIGRTRGFVINGGTLHDGSSAVEMRFHQGCEDGLIVGVNGKNDSYGISLDVDPTGISAEEIEIVNCKGFVSKITGQFDGTSLSNGKVVIGRDPFSYVAANVTEAKEVYQAKATLISETFSAGSNLPFVIQQDRGNIDANSDVRFIMFDELGAICNTVTARFNWEMIGPNKFPLA